MDVERHHDAVVVTTDAYRLELPVTHPQARLTATVGGSVLRLMLLAALDTDHGPDGTLAVESPDIDDGADAVRVRIRAESTAWDAKELELTCRRDEIGLRWTVRGAGRLTETRLLGGPYTGTVRWGGGTFHSGWTARKLFCPSPDDPSRVLTPAGEPAAIGVVGSSMPGRGHWFFTPAPFLVAGTDSDVDDPDDPAAPPWTILELRASLEDCTFTEMRYAPILGGFSLLLDYDGETPVDGEHTTPELVVRLGVNDPYTAIGDHAERLRTHGNAPTVERHQPPWWTRPIFCGWGEQCRQARHSGTHASTWSRQDAYDRWLALLADHDIRPGTITIDDKWQRTYGRNEVDEERWRDLRGWIADRHGAGQRVLLWFKAWDPEGLPDEACITDRLGQRVAADPESPAYASILEASLHRMLGREGLDADGLKVDFTAQTPSGPGLRHAGASWGARLLHRLLERLYDGAKEAKPDALIVTHTPNPHFADVTDMIRLNDLLRLDEPDPFAAAVPQMRHRARIARAVDPGWLIDTDDWCMPTKAEWRSYLALKPDLGVPALYYATGTDLSDEDFTEDDYIAIREAWARWEAHRVQDALTDDR